MADAVTDSEASAHMAAEDGAADLPIWREAMAGLEWLALRASPVYYGCGVPRGDGSPVVLVPGFLGDDFYLLELALWLGRVGYRPYASRIGRNADCLEALLARLLETIELAHRDTGSKVHLIGHSLGGLLSRSAAVSRSDRVASVIALGAPVRAQRAHPFVMQAAARVRARVRARIGRGQRPDCYSARCDCGAVRAMSTCAPASVPHVAIYTKSDGIVDWRGCVTDDPARDVQVTGTHTGLVFNATVYRLIGDRLAALAAPALQAA